MNPSQEQYIEADDYYDMALAWIENNQLQKAEECLNHAIDLNPRFTYAYITLAEVYAAKENYHDAVKSLRQGRHFDPGFHRLYFLMSYYSHKDGDSKNALKFIEKALELDHANEEYILFKDILV